MALSWWWSQTGTMAVMPGALNCCGGQGNGRRASQVCLEVGLGGFQVCYAASFEPIINELIRQRTQQQLHQRSLQQSQLKLHHLVHKMPLLLPFFHKISLFQSEMRRVKVSSSCSPLSPKTLQSLSPMPLLRCHSTSIHPTYSDLTDRPSPQPLASTSLVSSSFQALTHAPQSLLHKGQDSLTCLLHHLAQMLLRLIPCLVLVCSAHPSTCL